MHRLTLENAMWTNQGYQSERPHSDSGDTGHFRACSECLTKWDEFPFFTFQSLLYIDFFPLQFLPISSNFPVTPNHLRCSRRGEKDTLVFVCVNGCAYIHSIKYSFNIHSCIHGGTFAYSLLQPLLNILTYCKTKLMCFHVTYVARFSAGC